jgi:hypothetical protein
MPRYFTVSEAEGLLPRVEQHLRDAISLKSDYQRADEQLNDALRRIAMLGGSVVDREQILSIRAVRDTSAARLKELFEAIQEIGCEVKDLDIGLIDFLTLYNGEEVYLCWKLGEQGISHWHGLQEGFAGRKAIDDEFLGNHGPQKH